MPPACIYSGQIGALTPHQADFLFGHTRTDATPPRAFTQAKSGPLRRIKRTSSSAATISDGRGPCALNEARGRAVTYPAEGHLEDYSPLHGGSIASTALRKHTRKKKSWT
jgi:hypothetical protein